MTITGTHWHGYHGNGLWIAYTETEFVLFSKYQLQQVAQVKNHSTWMLLPNQPVAEPA